MRARLIAHGPSSVLRRSMYANSLRRMATADARSVLPCTRAPARPRTSTSGVLRPFHRVCAQTAHVRRRCVGQRLAVFEEDARSRRRVGNAVQAALQHQRPILDLQAPAHRKHENRKNTGDRDGMSARKSTGARGGVDTRKEHRPGMVLAQEKTQAPGIVSTQGKNRGARDGIGKRSRR